MCLTGWEIWYKLLNMTSSGIWGTPDLQYILGKIHLVGEAVL
jgi:hypothetical protein